MTERRARGMHHQWIAVLRRLTHERGPWGAGLQRQIAAQQAAAAAAAAAKVAKMAAEEGRGGDGDLGGGAAGLDGTAEGTGGAGTLVATPPAAPSK